ncbi:prephenate dehydrogenase [Candidatus Endobugula sertula]|uniref:prephenate dehydrogenase n=1 Tax=Candidatus Endobugula sertula TaxID=62101 RepID=A0A1D2QSV7_9GAMM|nr:prephenate dehydrogenase [Candidatus Endobugula sertula]
MTILSKDASINKLIVIGLGLIGGSLAAALREVGICKEVIGVVRKQETIDVALTNGIVDRAVLSLKDIADELSEGDIIFIAVPVLSIKSILEDIHGCVDPAVTITDGASVKGSIVDAVASIYGKVPEQFVPGHPIAGSEKSGITAADATLYANHRVILTPLADTGYSHIARITAMWEAVQAEVLIMPVKEHDKVLAATSHLPHAIAYSLLYTLANDSKNENIFRYAAGGFRDFTRIASSDPRMWHDIMRANSHEVLKAIDLFQTNLNQLRQAIEEDNGDYLLDMFTRSKIARDHFTALMNKTTPTNS